MARAAAGARVAAAGPSALVVRGGVLEVALPRESRARRERASPVADLHEVTQLVVRLVRVGLVPVVALERRHGFEFHGEVPAVGQGQSPGAVTARRTFITLLGKGPRWQARRTSLRLLPGQLSQPVGGDGEVHPGRQGHTRSRGGTGTFRAASAAVADRDPVGSGNRHAQQAEHLLAGRARAPPLSTGHRHSVPDTASMATASSADGWLVSHSPSLTNPWSRGSRTGPAEKAGAFGASWPSGSPGPGVSPVPLSLPGCQPTISSIRLNDHQDLILEY
jgi:hypothetical protein